MRPSAARQIGKLFRARSLVASQAESTGINRVFFRLAASLWEYRLASRYRFAGGSHAIQNPCFTVARRCIARLPPPRPCRARLRLQAQTVTQARSMLRETPASLAGRISSCKRISFRRRMACHSKPLLHPLARRKNPPISFPPIQLD